MFEVEALERALQSLGAVLESRGLSYEVLVVGGSSLLLLGVIRRPTADLDVVGLADGGVYRSADPLPGPLADAAADVGLALQLAPNWLNAGAASLMDFGLPEGFEERVTIRRYGGLAIHLAGRVDLICFKLYATVDQGPRSKHFGDLQDLAPTQDELLVAARWTLTHDTSSGYRGELLKALAMLGVEVNDADL
jgi:Nucleotidyltransferase of unknown function (DUF6036)